MVAAVSSNPLPVTIPVINGTLYLRKGAIRKYKPHILSEYKTEAGKIN